MTPCILSLPSELLRDIALNLLSSDKQTFWSSCRRIKNATEQETFSTLKLVIGSNRAVHCTSLLTALAENKTLSTKYAKSLEIETLALAFRTTSSGFDQAGLLTIFMENVHRIVPEEKYSGRQSKSCRAVMAANLSPAIQALQNVQSVRWNICEKDPSWAVHIVARTLGSLPRLSTLSIAIPSNHCTVPLHDIRGLSSLSLSVDEKYALQQVKPILQQSPELKSLCIYSLAGVTNVTGALDLNILFDDTSTKSQLRRSLTRMSLQGCSIAEIPHFQNLKRLYLLGWTLEQGSQDNKGFWHSLLRANVFLEDIIVSVSPDEQLLDYLDAYSGLTLFTLVAAAGAEIGDLLAKRLIQVLLRHRETLQWLRLEPKNTCAVCATRETIPIFEGFTSLRTLLVTVPDVHGKLINDVVNHLFEVVSKLPHLHVLTITALRRGNVEPTALSLQYEHNRTVLIGTPTVTTTRMEIVNAVRMMPVKPGTFENLIVRVGMRYTFMVASEDVLMPYEGHLRRIKKVSVGTKRMLKKVFLRRWTPQGKEEEGGIQVMAADDGKLRFRLLKNEPSETDLNMRYLVRHW